MTSRSPTESRLEIQDTEDLCGATKTSSIDVRQMVVTIYRGRNGPETARIIDLHRNSAMMRAASQAAG
jgi:hypothetical protein